jgi:uncharacterized membrane protein (DUF485 family)
MPYLADPPLFREESTMSSQTINWAAIDNDPRFRDLHAKKSRFLWGLMAFSVIYYFALPIGAAYFTDLFKIKLWGVINFGLLFALSEFIVAWLIAYFYARKAGEFDAMANDIIRQVQTVGGQP